MANTTNPVVLDETLQSTNEKLDAIKKAIENNHVDVIDGLTSTSTTDALSANQGRMLNDELSNAYKISDLASTSIADTDYIPVSTSGGSKKKSTWSNLKAKFWTYVQSQLAAVATSGSYNDLADTPNLSNYVNKSTTGQAIAVTTGVAGVDDTNNDITTFYIGSSKALSSAGHSYGSLRIRSMPASNGSAYFGNFVSNTSARLSASRNYYMPNRSGTMVVTDKTDNALIIFDQVEIGDVTLNSTGYNSTSFESKMPTHSGYAHAGCWISAWGTGTGYTSPYGCTFNGNWIMGPPNGKLKGIKFMVAYVRNDLFLYNAN